MSLNLEIKEEITTNSNKHSLNLHYLPASIEGNGPANVQQYFDRYTIKQEGEILMNSFRGYPLQGCEFNVPENYQGIVFQETQKPLDKEAHRKFKAVGTFNKFTFWNYDKTPSENDALRKAFDVIDVAEAMSKNVTKEELENIVKENL